VDSKVYEKSLFQLYLMKFFRHRHLPISSSHNELCKVDTILSPSEVNDNKAQNNQGNP